MLRVHGKLAEEIAAEKSFQKRYKEGALSKKSLRAKAIAVLRLGVRGSPALQRPLGTTRDGKPRQIGPKGGNRV